MKSKKNFLGEGERHPPKAKDKHGQFLEKFEKQLVGKRELKKD